MLLRPKASSGSDRVARTERALVRLHSLILGMLGGFGLFAASSQGAPPVLVWVSGGLWLAVGVDLLVRGERPIHLGVLWAALAAGSWAQADVADGALPAGLAVGIFGLSAARLLTVPAFGATMIVAAGTSIGITAVVQSSALVMTVDDAVLSVSMAVAIRGLLRTVEGASEQLRDADRDLAAARKVEVQAVAERDAATRAARTLHDDVLTALRGIATGWPEDIVRGDARSAAQAVRQATETSSVPIGGERIPGGLDAYVRSITSNSPIVLDLEVSGDPRWGDVSSSGADALVRATIEVLRNVERHSGAQRAALSLDLRPEALQVRVIDHGRGRVDRLDPGFGLRSSVIEPLEREGGTARFEDTEGGGITAVLTLPRLEVERSDRLAQAYRATMSSSLARSPVTSLVLPIAAAYSYVALRNSASWPSPAIAALLLVGYTIVLAFIVSRLRVRPPTVGWLSLVVGSLIVLTAVGLAAAPDGAMLDFRGWPVGYAAVIVSTMLLVVPTPTGLALLAPFPVLVVVAWRLEPGLSNGAGPWSAVNAALMLPLGLLAVGVALRRVGRRVEADHSAATRLWLEDAGRQAALWISEVHLAHTRQRVVPWLASIADGTVPVGESRTVETANLLALEVRDDLYAPGFFNDDLRQAVGQFRQLGGQVRIRPSDFSEQAGRAAAAVLRDLLGLLLEPRRITLSFTSDSGSENNWRLVMVPPDPEATKELTMKHRVESDSDRTVIVPQGVVSK